MRILKVLIVLGILAGAGFGVKQYMAKAEISKRAGEELKAEESELTQCKERLKMFYTAWDSYRKDHKGVEPPTIDSLVPKYVKDASLFECPTYVRWSAKGRPLSRGDLTIDGKKFNVSYGFQWLTASYGIAVKKLQDKAPLVMCETHREAVYIAAYKKQFDLKSFDEEEAKALVSEVKSCATLAVRRDGTVGDYDRASSVATAK